TYITVPSNATSYDFHVEFKAGTASAAVVGIQSPSGAQDTELVDLTNGSFATSYASGSVGAFAVTSKGSGWYEAKFSGAVDQTGQWAIWLGVANGQNGLLNY